MSEQRETGGRGGLIAAGAVIGIIVMSMVAAVLLLRRAADPRREACVDATGKLLGSLGEPVEIRAYVTRGQPKLDAFVKELSGLLGEYERAGRGKLRFQIVEPKTEEQRAEAKEAGLQEVAFGEPGGEGDARITRGFMGISVRYKEERETIPVLSAEQPKGMEFWISNKIREVRARAEHRSVRIGLLSGKGEISIGEQNLIVQPAGGGPTLRGVLEQAVPYYKLEEVDLRGGEGEIPAELSALLITQPGQEISEAELRRIDAFMMRGGKGLAVFASAVNVAPRDPKLTATLDTHGLPRLLEGYGVEMKRDAVLDWGRPMQIPLPGSSRLLAPAIAIVEPTGEGASLRLDGTFAPFFRLEELVFPFPSTLVPHPERQPGATIRVAARTTPNATAEVFEERSLAPAEGGNPAGQVAQRAIAISVEGVLTSAFGQGSGRDARVLVVSSSQFLANPFARAAADGAGDTPLLAQVYAQKYLTAMILVFKNTLDWAADEDDLSACTVL